MRNLALIGLIGVLGAGCDEYTAADWLDFRDYFVKLDATGTEVASLTTEIGESIGFEPLHRYDKVNQGFSLFVPVPIADEIAVADRVDYILEVPEEGFVPPDEEDSKVDVSDPISVNPDEIPESIARIGGPWTLGLPEGLHVAVIDTGIDSQHPDLNVVAEFDAVAISGGSPSNGTDPNGHGTHVAGTIGAISNGEGVVGVTPGVPMHAVRVLDGSGSGLFTDIIAGLEYVLENPEIRVVNMSLGGFGDPDELNDPMREAIQALEDNGVIVVIAAGNDDVDTNQIVPAGYDLGVVVSAYDASNGSDNGFASFSNHGAAVDVAAPGVKILSTWPGDEYAELQGTSMATPAVAGSAVAWLAANPEGTPGQFRRQVRNTGESVTGNGNEHPEPMVANLPLWGI